jgi:hypothetical protein
MASKRVVGVDTVLSGGRMYIVHYEVWHGGWDGVFYPIIQFDVAVCWIWLIVLTEAL